VNKEVGVVRNKCTSAVDVVRLALAEALEIDLAEFPSAPDVELGELPGVTSLALTRALGQIEERLGIDLYEVTFDVRTVENLAAVVQRKVDGRPVVDGVFGSAVPL
jgi:acyl carrier protein